MKQEYLETAALLDRRNDLHILAETRSIDLPESFTWVAMWKEILNITNFTIVVCRLLTAPAICKCISGTDLLNFTCCHTEIEVADQTFHLTQSQYTNTAPTSPSTDTIMPGAWQGSHYSVNFQVTCMTQHQKNPGASVIQTRDLLLSRRTP